MIIERTKNEIIIRKAWLKWIELFQIELMS